MQKYANLVALEKCCQTHIFLQNFVLIQPRTSPPKICKILLTQTANPNLSTKTARLLPAAREAPRRAVVLRVDLCEAAEGGCGAGHASRSRPLRLRTRRVVANFWKLFGKCSLVFGCIGTDFCKKIRVLQHF